MSVLPEFQRRGIGKALVHDGLALLQTLGAGGCVLVGNPAYYRWFEFQNLPGMTLEGVPPENFLALPLSESTACRSVVFHRGFAATG